MSEWQKRAMERIEVGGFNLNKQPWFALWKSGVALMADTDWNAPGVYAAYREQVEAEQC